MLHVSVSGADFAAVGDEAVQYMIALYSYNPIELSPNIDADVSNIGEYLTTTWH